MSRTLALLLLAGVTLASALLWFDQAIAKPFRDLLVDTGDAR
jgi:hypothetical protein